MLRSAGFVIETHPEAEVYICRAGPRSDDALPVYPARGRTA
jgi:tRNA (mo5U34)-methyltransferase